MIEKRIVWSMFGCLFWTFCFVVLALVPEVAKMFSQPADLGAVHDRDWVRDFKNVWIGAWVCACFACAVVTDYILGQLLSQESDKSRFWGTSDWSAFMLLLMIVTTVLILSTKLWPGLENLDDFLVAIQLIFGTVVKFLSFKSSELSLIARKG